MDKETARLVRVSDCKSCQSDNQLKDKRAAINKANLRRSANMNIMWRPSRSQLPVVISCITSEKYHSLCHPRMNVQYFLLLSKFFGGAAFLHVGLPVCLPVCPSACLSVPVSFWRGFVDNTNI